MKKRREIFVILINFVFFYSYLFKVTHLKLKAGISFIYTYISYIYIYIDIFNTLNISFYFSHLFLMFSSFSKRTTMKTRHFCPFCAISTIFIGVHISVAINNL